MKKVAIRCLLSVGVMSFGGCIMRSEGDQIQSDLDRLKADIATLQRHHHDLRTSQSKRHDDLASRIKFLESEGAHSGADYEAIRNELQSLRGQLEEADMQVQELLGGPEQKVEEKLPHDEPLEKPADVIPETIHKPLLKKEYNFEAGKRFFDRGQYQNAIQVFEAFIEKHKKTNDPLLDQAYFWKGKACSFLAQGSPAQATKQEYYKKAILSFQQLLTQFPQSKKHVDALYHIAQSLDAISRHKDASTFYEEIIHKYPKHPLAAEAKQHLKPLERFSK